MKCAPKEGCRGIGQKGLKGLNEGDVAENRIKKKKKELALYKSGCSVSKEGNSPAEPHCPKLVWPEERKSHPAWLERNWEQSRGEGGRQG